MRNVDGWPPRWLTPVPQEALDNGEGHLVTMFAEAYGVITKDSVAGKAGTPLILRDWQKELIYHVFAGDDEGYRHRINLIGLPRKSGKSAVASLMGVYSLIMGKVKGGAEIYSVAAEKEQARIVFGDAKRIIEASEELTAYTKLYRDAIEVPSTNSVYRVLSAENLTKEGLNPSFVLFDELHAQKNRELFDVMSLAMGARGSLASMVCITTAGLKNDNTGQPSIANQLYEYGKAQTIDQTDPSFFMSWWEAPADADHRLESTWAMANPGLGDISSIEDFRSAVRITPEAEFRTKRCNQWVNTKNTWLPAGVWENLGKEDEVALLPTDEYVIGFDGSWKNDSTSVVVVVMPREEGDAFRVFRANSWEKDFMLDDDSWVVDKQEVANWVIDFFRANPGCRELAADPTYWQDEMMQWAEAGIPVSEYPNTISRTVPATSKLYEAIMAGKIIHNNDPLLNKHMENCILKMDSKGGSRLTKDYRNPTLKIDNAIALMMAYDRASRTIEPDVVPQFFF